MNLVQSERSFVIAIFNFPLRKLIAILFILPVLLYSTFLVPVCNIWPEQICPWRGHIRRHDPWTAPWSAWGSPDKPCCQHWEWVCGHILDGETRRRCLEAHICYQRWVLLKHSLTLSYCLGHFCVDFDQFIFPPKSSLLRSSEVSFSKKKSNGKICRKGLNRLLLRSLLTKKMF